MNRSDYTYSIENFSGSNVIVIEELNLGNTSVTNNIENVLNEICRIEKLFIHSYMIVYKDSEGVWDGYNYQKEIFLALNESTWQDAVSKYAQIQLNKIEQ
ncbi:MAG TPA: hypothetical protein VN726_06600 [Hanamia sp.]|nr:hypothetical protein [Hanamia sp.]